MHARELVERVLAVPGGPGTVGRARPGAEATAGDRTDGAPGDRRGIDPSASRV